MENLKNIFDDAAPEGCWHRFPGTAFEIFATLASAKQMKRLNRVAIKPAKNGKPAQVDWDRVVQCLYAENIHDIRGLTPRVIHESLKVYVPAFAEYRDGNPDYDRDFSQGATKEDKLYMLKKLIDESGTLAPFLGQPGVLFVDQSLFNQEEEAAEAEKKIS